MRTQQLVDSLSHVITNLVTHPQYLLLRHQPWMLTTLAVVTVAHSSTMMVGALPLRQLHS